MNRWMTWWIIFVLFTALCFAMPQAEKMFDKYHRDKIISERNSCENRMDALRLKLK